eukprot:11159235-Lingulodinium_polyedra.AAC.1
MPGWQPNVCIRALQLRRALPACHGTKTLVGLRWACGWPAMGMRWPCDGPAVGLQRACGKPKRWRVAGLR